MFASSSSAVDFVQRSHFLKFKETGYVLSPRWINNSIVMVSWIRSVTQHHWTPLDHQSSVDHCVNKSNLLQDIRAIIPFTDLTRVVKKFVASCSRHVHNLFGIHSLIAYLLITVPLMS
jgi:hypothetical protein